MAVTRRGIEAATTRIKKVDVVDDQDDRSLVGDVLQSSTLKRRSNQ
jgi:hypothetical protein